MKEYNISLSIENRVKLGISHLKRITPVMEQWALAKLTALDSILLFRMGDFYEIFGYDAEKVSNLLDLVLTSRNKKNTIPMAGFPCHSSSNYIKKLISYGFKVAICDQIEEKKETKGLVQRKIIQIITPGTYLENIDISNKTYNFILAIFSSISGYSIAYLDYSSGEFFTTYYYNIDYLLNEIIKISPSEIILTCNIRSNYILYLKIKARLKKKKINIEFINLPQHILILKNINYFSKGTRLNMTTSSIFICEALLQYIIQTQGNLISHIRFPKYYTVEEKLIIDSTTQNHLSINNTFYSKKNNNTLTFVLNKTLTSIGKRYLQKILTAPHTSYYKIISIQNIVSYFIHNPIFHNSIKSILNEISDINRIITKSVIKKTSLKDLKLLKNTLHQLNILIFSLKENLSTFNYITNNLSFPQKIYIYLNLSIKSLVLSKKKKFNPFYYFFDHKITLLYDLSSGFSSRLHQLETHEKKKHNLTKLKIKYKKNFGYFFEISKSYLKYIPDYFIHKQTLASRSRFTTISLQLLETELIKINNTFQYKESIILKNIYSFILTDLKNLKNLSKFIGKIDTYQSFALISKKYSYTRPEILKKQHTSFILHECKHPILDILNQNIGNITISNSIQLESTKSKTLLVTGPNMGGKSTILCQVGLIQLLAQTGCFIPSLRSKISICDRIFTRVGADDDILDNQSTFMMEMNETSYILKNATPFSLILLDEIGRGTSTHDGVAIAWAVTEYIHKVILARTLFTTHYHELAKMIIKLIHAKNMHVSVLKINRIIRFLYKLNTGPSLQSYGIYVAELAKLPKSIIKKAYNISTDIQFYKKSIYINKVLNKYKIQPNIIFSVFYDKNIYSIPYIKYVYLSKKQR